MTSDKFIGYLVSVECKNVFYQGIVTNIDSNKAIIQLKNCFQNGLHCGNKLIDIKTVEIENIEILADPENAFNILKPKTLTNSIDRNEVLLNSVSQENNRNNISTSSTSSTSSSSDKKSSNDNEKSLSVNNNINNSRSNQYYSRKVNQNVNRHNESTSSSTQLNKSRRKDLSNGYSNNQKQHRRNHHNSNEAFFGSDSNDNDEFDFEQNLALFDKNAFYEELEGHSRPSDDNEENSTAFDSILKHISLNHTQSSHRLYETRTTEKKPIETPTVIYHPISLANLFSAASTTHKTDFESNSIPQSLSTSSVALSQFLSNTMSNGGGQQPHGAKNGNYRFDEMVLDTGEPINMQQITVPVSNVTKRYVTDDGFIVPCIDYTLRQMIFEQSYKQGFNIQRQIECMGRCCTEMALQLVGGPLRFSPKNNHQKPSILVLVNNTHIQGVYAICTARLLSIRNVKIYLFICNQNFQNKEEQSSENDIEAYFKNELSLFRSTDSSNYKILNSIDEIKSLHSIDLILNGLESPKPSKISIDQQLIKYIENCKASVVSIDPPVNGSVIQSKWCITPVLPMAMSKNCGRVYLCDLGFTKNMFQSVNIKYQSPFGAKFLIPLHND